MTADWYREAVIYELHVRAFADSNGDGYGDFNGLISKLDYLQDLGVTALWLLPFYPSPLRDDGYDIADYTGVHPRYGTLPDVKRLLKEAHRRGLKVITELVVNHTSDQHPWFQRARRAPKGSRERDFYVWSDDTNRYSDARIIFRDFEASNWSWDAVAQSNYWHRFYAHQPDLNFDNPAVERAIMRVLDLWLGMGVDGLRLDAIPYLYEREGTSCENLPETHAFLKRLRRHVDERYPDRMLLAEANQWPEDAVSYFGDGDECHMAFHFPVMPRLFMALRMEDRFPLTDILLQTPAIPESCQWAMFLRNHDELTLEMVTDEERDYMYRAYASDPQARINLGIRRRLAPLLGNDRRKIELMNLLLFSLPGTPVIYYGDEIGMGDNVFLGDRDGVRTPMQWSSDRNAGFSTANPQRLYLPVVIDPEYHYQSLNVEAQRSNPNSLWRWMRQLITLRRRHPALSRGDLQFIRVDDPKVLAFTRTYGDETILVVANLSARTRQASIPMAEHAGSAPVELFGGSRFTPITEQPTQLVLGPYATYWFALERSHLDVSASAQHRPVLDLRGELADALADGLRRPLGASLPSFLAQQRWFAGKGRTIRSAELGEVNVVARERDEVAALAVVHVEYQEGDPERYQLALLARGGADGRALLAEHPTQVLGELRRDDGERIVLADAPGDPWVAQRLLNLFQRRPSRGAPIQTLTTPALRPLLDDGESLTPAPLGAEQSNSSVLFGERLLLKLYRRLENGVNPDVEIGSFLTGKAHFEHVPALAGALMQRDHGEASTLAVLSEFVPSGGDLWSVALEALGRMYAEAQSADEATALDQLGEGPLGAFGDMTTLLGRRCAELHVALASDRDDPAFAPEPFTVLYQRGMYQSLRTQIRRNLAALRRNLGRLGTVDRQLADALIAAEATLLGKIDWLRTERVRALRIRHHGDLHLGQVLSTGRDVVIIDFEGEPARPLSERRIKRSPLRDVAGMMRSFDYAAHAALRAEQERATLPDRPDALAALHRLGRRWSAEANSAFWEAYRSTPGIEALLPSEAESCHRLLDALVLEKALYEVGYELANRPAWVGIPLVAVTQLAGLPVPEHALA